MLKVDFAERIRLERLRVIVRRENLWCRLPAVISSPIRLAVARRPATKAEEKNNECLTVSMDFFGNIDGRADPVSAFAATHPFVACSKGCQDLLGLEAWSVLGQRCYALFAARTYSPTVFATPIARCSVRFATVDP